MPSTECDVAARATPSRPWTAWRLDAFAHALTSLSDHTVAAYASDVRVRRLGARSDVLEPAAVERRTCAATWRSSPRASSRAHSIARKVAALRRYFRWLRRNGVVAADPTIGLSVPGRRGSPAAGARPARLDQLLDAPAADDEPHWRRLRDDAVLEMLYGRGCGSASCAGSSLARFAGRRRRDRVGQGRQAAAGAAQRPAVAALRALAGGPPRGVPRRAPAPCCSATSGAPLTPRDVRRILDRRSPAPTHPHALRHTLRDPSARRRRRPAAVQELLGHADVATTQRYTHVSSERLRAAYARGAPTSMSIVPDDADLADCSGTRWFEPPRPASPATTSSCTTRRW